MATTETVAEEANVPSTHEYIEYLGDPDGPHGTAFLTSHTIPKGDTVWARLKVAKELGADYVIDVNKEDPLARIKEITAGKGVDVALDCTAGAGTIPMLLGIEALKRKGGTIVVQGELKEFPNFPLEKFTVKFITMHSARGHSYKACELALEQLASKRFPLDRVTTHRFGLKDVDLAIKSVGGKGVPDVIHASLMPWM